MGLRDGERTATGKNWIVSSPKDHYPNDEAEPDSVPRFEAALDEELSRLGPSRVTILLIGGDASARLAAARALHRRSPRAQLPFLSYDCSGLDSSQIELGLFGGPDYVPANQGAIQRAGGGTLYIAAIDELPLLEQPRLLRYLDQACDTRVVASTLSDLLSRVEQGHFRLDLAERLSLIELVLQDRR